MKADLAIRGGRIIDPASQLDQIGTVVVAGGRVAAIEPDDTPVVAGQVIDARGLLVLPGLIDIHAHCFVGETALGLSPDQIGLTQGVTTVVDAGSSGVANLERFRRQAAAARTRVLAFLNLSREGLAQGRGELSDPALWAPEETLAALKGHGDFLVGVKARASASAVGDQEITPIVTAKEVARAAGVPLMVHIGNAPPALEEILPLLEAGDVVSHAFHGKAGGIYRNGGLIPEAEAALERGVLFDVAHGQSSFSFTVVRRFLAAGRFPDIISSDLWRGNEIGPVFSLLHTMTKLYYLGMPLGEVVAAATWRSAIALGREGELGSLAPGRAPDLSLIELARGEFPLVDSEGLSVTAPFLMKPALTIRNGEILWPGK